MKPTIENLKSILENGTSLEFNPENLVLNDVRKLVRHARKHDAKITLQYTDAFTPAEWCDISAEGGRWLSIVDIRL